MLAIKVLRSHLDGAKRRLQFAQSDVDRARTELRRMESGLQDLEFEVSDLEGDIEAFEQRLPDRAPQPTKRKYFERYGLMVPDETTYATLAGKDIVDQMKRREAAVDNEDAEMAVDQAVFAEAVSAA